MSNQNDSEIIIEDGLRKVKPYYHDFSSHVKPRWIGMKVIDMYLKEFPYYSRDYLVKIKSFILGSGNFKREYKIKRKKDRS